MGDQVMRYLACKRSSLVCFPFSGVRSDSRERSTNSAATKSSIDAGIPTSKETVDRSRALPHQKARFYSSSSSEESGLFTQASTIVVKLYTTPNIIFHASRCTWVAPPSPTRRSAYQTDIRVLLQCTQHVKSNVDLPARERWNTCVWHHEQRSCHLGIECSKQLRRLQRSSGVDKKFKSYLNESQMYIIRTLSNELTFY